MTSSMNTTRASLILCLSLALASLSILHAQTGGDPTSPPSGTPARTMKSLDQIEARTPLVEFAAGAPSTGIQHTTSQPGSYYLTANLTVPSGDAITINSSGVTLDLNGFTLSSTDASRADRQSGSNVRITNGHIASGTSWIPPRRAINSAAPASTMASSPAGQPRLRRIEISITGTRYWAFPGGSNAAVDCRVGSVARSNIRGLVSNSWSPMRARMLLQRIWSIRRRCFGRRRWHYSYDCIQFRGTGRPWHSRLRDCHKLLRIQFRYGRQFAPSHEFASWIPTVMQVAAGIYSAFGNVDNCYGLTTGNGIQATGSVPTLRRLGSNGRRPWISCSGNVANSTGSAVDGHGIYCDGNVTSSKVAHPPRAAIRMAFIAGTITDSHGETSNRDSKRTVCGFQLLWTFLWRQRSSRGPS